MRLVNLAMAQHRYTVFRALIAQGVIMNVDMARSRLACCGLALGRARTLPWAEYIYCLHSIHVGNHVGKFRIDGYQYR